MIRGRYEYEEPLVSDLVTERICQHKQKGAGQGQEETRLNHIVSECLKERLREFPHYLHQKQLIMAKNSHYLQLQHNFVPL